MKKRKACEIHIIQYHSAFPEDIGIKTHMLPEGSHVKEYETTAMGSHDDMYDCLANFIVFMEKRTGQTLGMILTHLMLRCTYFKRKELDGLAFNGKSTCTQVDPEAWKQLQEMIMGMNEKDGGQDD